MARALLIANPENATIEELKQLMDQPDVDIWFADVSGWLSKHVSSMIMSAKLKKNY